MITPGNRLDWCGDRVHAAALTPMPADVMIVAA
jgi:hypothetical protein